MLRWLEILLIPIGTKAKGNFLKLLITAVSKSYTFLCEYLR